MNYIVYEQKGMVAVLTISREKALNALNSEVLAELEAAVDAIDLETVRCLVITGAGERSFVAGADIGEMSKLCLLYTSFCFTCLPFFKGKFTYTGQIKILYIFRESPIYRRKERGLSFGCGRYIRRFHHFPCSAHP